MARTDYGAILSTVIKDTSDAIREVNGTSALIAPNDWGVNIRTMKSADDYENVLDQLIQEEVASAPVASFSDGANDIPLKELSLSINPTQAGSGDPAPDNIRPITGVSSVNVTRTGKNWYFSNTVDYTTVGVNLKTDGKGKFEVTGTSTGGWINPTSLRTNITLPVGTYTISASISGTMPEGNTANVGVQRVSGTQVAGYLQLSSTNPSASRTFTVSEETVLTQGMYFSAGEFDAEITLQIESGATATAYEPYTGNTYLVQLGDTYYGATLDVVRGKLVVDRVLLALKDVASGWTYQSDMGNGYYRYTYLNSLYKYSGNEICDMLPTTTLWSDYRWAFYITNTGRLYIYSDIDNVTDFRNWLTTNEPHVLLSLTTPIEIDLTHEQINSLLGQNHIWHDGNGDTSCIYSANGQLYVDQHST